MYLPLLLWFEGVVVLLTMLYNNPTVPIYLQHGRYCTSTTAGGLLSYILRTFRVCTCR